MSKDTHPADRFSELSDEVLEIILSHLTMREVVSTSTLSRRWRHLWPYTSGSFDFDFGSAALTKMKETNVLTSLEAERARYVERVNKFINSHKAPTINAFRVKFDLHSCASKDIDNWIKFALKKRACRLEVDLGRVDHLNREEEWSMSFIEIKNCYTVPSFASLDRPNISRLTSLNLNFVDVLGETIEYILSNCPDLEYVCILNSPSLVGIKVVATCPKLKHLEIAHCHYLESVDIFHTPVLKTLSYSGPEETRLCFRDAPNLTDVSLGASYCSFFVTRFSKLPLDLSLIQKLVLDPCIDLSSYHKFPKLVNVTELELLFMEAQDRYRDGSISCRYAIQACPNLCRLSVKWHWTEEPVRRKQMKMRNKRRANKCLKVVDLWGFRGSSADTELASYIFSKAPIVEEIRVVTVNSDYLLGNIYGRRGILSVNESIRARNIASRIASQFAPTAQLLVRPLNNCTAI